MKEYDNKDEEAMKLVGCKLAFIYMHTKVAFDPM